MDQDQLIKILKEVAAKGDYLDKAENIKKSMNHGQYITQDQLKGDKKISKDFLVNALLVKNDIVTYLDTSDAHELHKNSEQRLLKTATPAIVRVMIGDAAVNLEERFDRLENILLEDGVSGDEWIQMVSDAGALYGMMSSLDILRQGMATIFPSQNFLDKTADKKLTAQPKP